MDETKLSQFDEAYRRHAGTVFRYCLFRTNCREQAEDVTAEVFAQLLRNGRQLESDHLGGWLLTVAANKCVDEARRKKRERALAAEKLPGPPGQEGWDDTELWRAVSRLKGVQQQVIYLRVVEDWSFGRIAKAIGKSEAATKMIFYRAIKRLCGLLGGSHARLLQERRSGETG